MSKIVGKLLKIFADFPRVAYKLVAYKKNIGVAYFNFRSMTKNRHFPN